MKKLLSVAFLLCFCLSAAAQGEKIKFDKKFKDAEASIFVISDAGRNGSFEQRRIGEVMGVYADSLGPEFVINCGDMFHYDGVQSVTDPLFMTNYESIYPAGELQCPWWGVLGNHEYRGSTQAVIDYSKVSRRWNVPAPYYARTFEGVDGDSVLVVFIDSAPLIDKYRIEAEYPDAHLQNPDAQVEWIDSTLLAAGARWKIVVGHHPIYSHSKKAKSETDQMQARVAQILEKHGVNLSLSGHVHTFQHLQPKGARTQYIVAPSASRGRPTVDGEHTKFNSALEGFIILSLNKRDITLSMIDRGGEVVYEYVIK